MSLTYYDTIATPRWGHRSHQNSAFHTFYSAVLCNNMPPRWVHSKYCTEAKGELCLHTNTLHPLCVGERAHVLEQYVNQIDPRDLPEFAPFPPFQNTPRYYYTEAKGQRSIVLAHKHITPIVCEGRGHMC